MVQKESSRKRLSHYYCHVVALSLPCAVCSRRLGIVLLQPSWLKLVVMIEKHASFTWLWLWQ